MYGDFNCELTIVNCELIIKKMDELMDSWGYLEWGVFLFALLEFIVLFYLFMERIIRKRNRSVPEFGREMVMDNLIDNEGEFNGSVFDIEEGEEGEERQPLPGLGENKFLEDNVETIHELSHLEKKEQKYDDQSIIILKTKLECANKIIPDVRFRENDSFEVIQWKQEIMKVKKGLGNLVNG